MRHDEVRVDRALLFGAEFPRAQAHLSGVVAIPHPTPGAPTRRTWPRTDQRRMSTLNSIVTTRGRPEAHVSQLPDPTVRTGLRRLGLLAAGAVLALTGCSATSTPAAHESASRATSAPSTVVCAQDTCPGGSPMRVAGPPVPFVWTLPSDFVQEYKAGSHYEDVTARTSDGTDGFVLIENIGAADPKDFTHGPSHPPGPGAKALASWLATRPYLHTTKPRQTTVGGQPAWVVDARIGTLPRDATPMGRDRVPGVYLLRLLPPQHDTDQLSAWFDQSYTTPTHLWLIDLPNGMVGYIEGPSVGSPREADIAHILQQMRFEPSSN